MLDSCCGNFNADANAIYYIAAGLTAVQQMLQSSSQDDCEASAMNLTKGFTAKEPPKLHMASSLISSRKDIRLLSFYYTRKQIKKWM